MPPIAHPEEICTNSRDFGSNKSKSNPIQPTDRRPFQRPHATSLSWGINMTDYEIATSFYQMLPLHFDEKYPICPKCRGKNAQLK